MSEVPNLSVKFVDVEAVRSLRHKVLRPQQDFSETLYPNDNLEGVAHLAVVIEKNIVAILSLYPESFEGNFNKSTFRLRGMAVDPLYQGRGLGKKILVVAFEYLSQQNAKVLWCNARTSALGFYEKFGFLRDGQEFVIEPIGPHFRLIKILQ